MSRTCGHRHKHDKRVQVGLAKRILTAATGSLALLLRTSTEGRLSAAGESFVASFNVSLWLCARSSIFPSITHLLT